MPVARKVHYSARFCGTKRPDALLTGNTAEVTCLVCSDVLRRIHAFLGCKAPQQPEPPEDPVTVEVQADPPPYNPDDPKDVMALSLGRYIYTHAQFLPEVEMSIVIGPGRQIRLELPVPPFSPLPQSPHQDAQGRPLNWCDP